METSEQNETREMIYELPIERIRPNPQQPRKCFSQKALYELAYSIRSVGLITPINVRRVGEYYEIIAGDRRYRACRLLGVETMKVIIESSEDPARNALVAVMENTAREDLNFFEEAEAFRDILRKYNMTQEQLAARLGKNQSTIANKMRVLRLSESVQQRIISAGLSERHARALLRLHDEKTQLAMLEVIVEEDLSVKNTEKLVEKELKRRYDKIENEYKNNTDKEEYIKCISRVIKRFEKSGACASMACSEHENGILITLNIQPAQAARF